jgi:pentatricopeptide repeat protein
MMMMMMMMMMSLLLLIIMMMMMMIVTMMSLPLQPASGVVANTVNYNTVLEALARAKQFDKARELLDRMFAGPEGEGRSAVDGDEALEDDDDDDGGGCDDTGEKAIPGVVSTRFVSVTLPVPGLGPSCVGQCPTRPFRVIRRRRLWSILTIEWCWSVSKPDGRTWVAVLKAARRAGKEAQGLQLFGEKGPKDQDRVRAIVSYMCGGRAGKG